MSEIDDLKDTILAITDEINRLGPQLPLRQPGDVDKEQLMRAWSMSESAVRRRMKLVGEHADVTGFQLLRVYDPEKRHEVAVLRKVSK